ncbi:MAG: asparagine synthase (glutamine-hydrolyzing) [Steroidobacteraceae bacterium]
MCGICGIVNPSEQDGIAPGLIERMRETLLHRGPDGAGIYLEPGIGLGHRRLSIVDVAHGQQPMYSADRRYVIVYNGEVFNHPELKPRLEADGVAYRTRSDTETVLHLFERYGTGCLGHMRGMFAFAIWDSHERSLFLARDRFGVKPLYYLHRPDGGLVFGSEIKTVLCGMRSRPTLNLAALPDFLANHAPSGEETLFECVRRLPPAHYLLWKDGAVSIRRYWDLEYESDPARVSAGSSGERALVEEYSQRLTEAVKIRLMSDVPLGMFLSGGIDSAAITATMAPLVKEPIRTFSVAFAEREANELEFARMVARAYATEHREVIVSPEDFFAALPRLIWHEDEPLAHPSSVALYFVSRLASEHVKVVLTGEGSDETLAGYNRYRVTSLNVRAGAAYERYVPRLVRDGMSRAIGALPRSWRARQIASRTFLTRGSGLDELYLDNFAVFARNAQSTLLTQSVRDQLGELNPYGAYHAALDRVRGRTLLSQMLYADVSTYLHELLMKQDQMSMAASIESRVPFLDHPLAEWVAKLPESMKLRGYTTKWILREAMRGRLPPEILSRRKMGFPVPVGAWLRGRWRPLLDEYLLSPRLNERRIFDSQAIETLTREHLAGANHSERLWALLTFEIWARIYLDGETPNPMTLSQLEAA